MRVRLAYGTTGMVVDLPDTRTTVVEPTYQPAAADPSALLTETLRRPVAGPRLREVVGRHGGDTRVAISMCDGTRPQPRRAMLLAILDELAGVVAPRDVVVLIATGTHRANTRAELEAMFGADLLDRVEVINHDSRDQASLRWVGRLGDGVPVWLNRHWLDASIRVTTGFVEPHFFAGFSGGPKMVAPGLAALETVLTLHDARRIGDPKATWGITVGNPVHDDVRAIAAATGVDFAFDVVLNREQQVVDAYAGELFAMHAAACERTRELAMRPVPHAYDVVVTTNSGFPLDQNLYQCVKGMSAAARVVRPGGTIICAASCSDGFPAHGRYRELLTSGSSPQELLRAIGERSVTEPDQWQVQIQAGIQAEARVVMVTDGLTAGELAEAHLGWAPDVGTAVAEALDRAGPDATVCALPEGPQTVPYVADRD